MERGKNSRDSHEPLKIMIVDDNIMCLQIASKLFRRRDFQVMPFQSVAEALYALRESKEEEVNLVLIETHVGSTRFASLTGPKFLELVKKEKNNLPLFTMCAHNDQEEDSEDQLSHRGFFHIKKPITDQIIETLRKKTLQKKAKKMAKTQVGESTKRSRKGRSNEKVKILNSLGSSHETEMSSSNELESEGENIGGRRKKRGKRLAWDLDLHNRFLIALSLLGEYASPQRIMEIMDVEGLSTKHVASHLQKHRIRVERLMKNNGNEAPPERSNSLSIKAATLNANNLSSVVQSSLTSINRPLKLDFSDFMRANFLKDHFGFFNKSNQQLMIMNKVPSSSDDGSWGLTWKRVDETEVRVSKDRQGETEIMVSQEDQHENETRVSKQGQHESETRVIGEEDQIIMQNSTDNDANKDEILAMDNIFNEIGNIDNINLLLEGIEGELGFNLGELCMSDVGYGGANLSENRFMDLHAGENSGNALLKTQELDNTNGSMANKAGEKGMDMNGEISLLDYQL